MFKFNAIKFNNKQNIRKYHVYKIASNVLTVFEADMELKKVIINGQIDKTFNKKIMTSSIFKEIRKSKALSDEQHTQKTLEAAKNIKRLCMEAYELCQKLEFDETMYEPIDEELIDFLELTNEMYPCVSKDIYEKIKMLKTK
jgi:hypothetical protein